MSKEKLTVESVVSGVYFHMSEGYRTSAEGSIINFLKQIKEEILLKCEEKNKGYYDYFVSNENICNVFNKYLNEK